MTEFLQFAALGLGAGAIYALLALGIMIVYRGSAVLNFAQGSFAMVGAFLFITVHTDHHWPLLPSIVVAIGVGAGLGLVTYQFVIRPLRTRSKLAQIIGTLGVLLVVQAVGLLLWGEEPVILAPFLPQKVLSLGAVAVPLDRVILLGIAAGATALLWAMYRFSKIGLAMRASSENAVGVETLGWSSDLLALVNWGLGGALGAAAGLLIAPITGVQVESMTLLVIPALAAALVGGFASLPLTLAGAVAIGVAQSELGTYVSQTGVADSLPFAVIMVVLVLRGTSLPARGFVAERLGTLGTGIVRPWVTAIATVGAGLLILMVFPPAFNTAVTASLVFAVLLLSVVVVTGYAGQLSLGQMAFGGIAALVAARLVGSAGLAFPFAVAAGVIVAVLVGVLFAVPAVRVRGVNLAVVTLGLGFATQALVFNNASLTYTSAAPGVPAAQGTYVGPQKLFGLAIDAVSHSNRYACVALVLFVCCALVVANLRRSRAGRRLIAVKGNERAAASLGISVVEAKLYAFAVAAALAGVAGMLAAFQGLTVTYDDFSPLNSIFAVGYAVIGGIGFVVGPLFGMMFAAGGIGNYLFDEVITGIDKWVQLIGGVTLLLILLGDPDGLVAMNLKAVRGEMQESKWSYLRLEVQLLRIYRHLRGARQETQHEPLPEPNRRRVQPATLNVTGLTVRFGGVVAADQVSLTVNPGEVVGLIGPNGAGKTTVIDAVTGFVRATAGEVWLGDDRISDWRAYRRAQAGLSRSFQSLELFEDVTVRENLRTACDSRDRLAYLTNLVTRRDKPLSPPAIAAIHEFGLEHDLDICPPDLSYGRRRLVGVARAVAVEPSILLLDEPAAGLDEQETAELARLVRGLATEWGIGILVVEHDMSFVMNTCDSITVMDFGRQIATGTPKRIRTNPTVIAAYLGELPEPSEPLQIATTTPK